MATVVDEEWLTRDEWRIRHGFAALTAGIGDDVENAGIRLDALGRHWDPAKHPRGRDGRFIKVGGTVRVFDERRGGNVIGLGTVDKIDAAGIHVRMTSVNDPANSKFIGQERVFDKSQIATIPPGQVRLNANGDVHPHDREVEDKVGKLVRRGDTVRMPDGNTAKVHLIGDDGRAAFRRDDGKLTTTHIQRVERLDHPNPEQLRSHERKALQYAGRDVPGAGQSTPAPRASVEPHRTPGPDRAGLHEPLERQGFGPAARHAARHGSSDEVREAIKNDPAHARLRQRAVEARNANLRQPIQRRDAADFDKLDAAAKRGVTGEPQPEPTPEEHVARVQQARRAEAGHQQNADIAKRVAERAPAQARDVGPALAQLRDAKQRRARAEEDAAHAGVHVPEQPGPPPPIAPPEPAKVPTHEQMLRRAARDAGVPDELHDALMEDIQRRDGTQTELGRAYKARNLAHTRVAKAKGNLGYHQRHVASAEKVFGKDHPHTQARRDALPGAEKAVRDAEARVPGAEQDLHDAVQRALGLASPPAAEHDPVLGLDRTELTALAKQFPHSLNQVPSGDADGRKAFWHAGFALNDALDTSRSDDDRKKAFARAESKLKLAASKNVSGAQTALDQLNALKNPGEAKPQLHEPITPPAAPDSGLPIGQLDASSIPDSVRQLSPSKLSDVARFPGDQGDVPGFHVEQVAASESGINRTWILTDSSTGRKFIVKRDTGTGGEEGVKAEVDASSALRQSGYYGASYVEAHRLDPSVLISTFVGEQNGITGHVTLSKASISPLAAYRKMADPSELIRARVMNVAFANPDRHQGNAMWGTDAKGKLHLLLFDHGLVNNARADNLDLRDILSVQGVQQGLAVQRGRIAIAKVSRLAYGPELLQHFNHIGRDESVGQISAEAERLLALADSFHFSSPAAEEGFKERLQMIIDDPGAVHDSVVSDFTGYRRKKPRA